MPDVDLPPLPTEVCVRVEVDVELRHWVADPSDLLVLERRVHVAHQLVQAFAMLGGPLGNVVSKVLLAQVYQSLPHLSPTTQHHQAYPI